MRGLHAGRCLVIALLLVACESVPLPFSHDSEVIEEPLALIPSGVGIVVRPFSGVPGPRGSALAEAMVGALKQADIFASTAVDDGRTRRFVLYASVHEMERNGGRVALSVQWKIVGPDLVNDENESRLEVDDLAWRSAEPATIKRVVAESASKLIARINEDSVVIVEPEPPPKVVVLPVLGLPEDGNAALTAAMETALRRVGVAVQEYAKYITRKEGTSLIVEGRVTLDPLKSGKLLKVVWTVTQADGTKLGSIAQQNETPLSMLKNPWAQLANAIAEGGAEGVSAFTQRRKGQ